MSSLHAPMYSDLQFSVWFATAQLETRDNITNNQDVHTINICTNNCANRWGNRSRAVHVLFARTNVLWSATHDKYLHEHLCNQMGKLFRGCACPVRTSQCILMCISEYVFATVQLEMRGCITNNHDAHTTNICANNCVNRWGNCSGVVHVPFARADVLWSAVQSIPLQQCS